MQRLQAATRVARGAAAACGAPQEPVVRAAMSARAAPRKALALRTARPNVAGLPAAREQHVPALRVAWQKLPPCTSRAFSAGASEEAEPVKPIEVTIEKVAKSETPQVATRAGTPRWRPAAPLRSHAVHHILPRAGGGGVPTIFLPPSRASPRCRGCASATRFKASQCCAGDHGRTTARGMPCHASLCVADARALTGYSSLLSRLFPPSLARPVAAVKRHDAEADRGLPEQAHRRPG